MQSPDLLMVCISAFLSVFVLLAILSLVMRLILVVFPARAVTSDAAVVAAISSVMQNVYPGTKITKVEEIK